MNKSAILLQQRRGGLQRKLIFSLHAALFLITATALGYGYLKQRAILKDSFQASMRQSVRHIQLSLERSPSSSAGQTTLQQLCEVMKGHADSGHEISIRDNSGAVIATSRNSISTRGACRGAILPESCSEPYCSHGDRVVSFMVDSAKTSSQST